MGRPHHHDPRSVRQPADLHRAHRPSDRPDPRPRRGLRLSHADQGSRPHLLRHHDRARRGVRPGRGFRRRARLGRNLVQLSQRRRRASRAPVRRHPGAARARQADRRSGRAVGRARPRPPRAAHPERRCRRLLGRRGRPRPRDPRPARAQARPAAVARARRHRQFAGPGLCLGHQSRPRRARHGRAHPRRRPSHLQAQDRLRRGNRPRLAAAGGVEPEERRAADGRRQPGLGPRHRLRDGAEAGRVRPRLDRGAADGRPADSRNGRRSPPWHLPVSPPARMCAAPARSRR